MEEWRAIPGYEGRYEVSDLGRVRSLRRGLMSIFENRGGYKVVGLRDGRRQRQVKVHRLVLLAFVGPPPIGHVGCHKDDNQEDNRLTNLRWGTPEENRAEQRTEGERNSRSRLTEDQVREIRSRLGRESQHALARVFGVSRSAIAHIASGHNWPHL